MTICDQEKIKQFRALGWRRGARFTMTERNQLQVCAIGWELFLQDVAREDLAPGLVAECAEAFGRAFHGASCAMVGCQGLAPHESAAT